MTYALENDKVILQLVDYPDLDWLWEQRNEEDQMRGSYQVWPLSRAEQERWFEGLLGDKTQRRFVIRSLAGARVGSIALTHIDYQDGGAELGIRISAGHRRNGYALAAIKMLTAWAFDEARLHRLYSEVFACNNASTALFEKCGWHLWGTKSYAHWQEGKWHNVYCFEVVQGTTLGGEFVSRDCGVYVYGQMKR